MKQTIYRFVSLPILLVMAVCLSVGCGPTEQPEPKPTPTPSTVSVTGVSLNKESLSLVEGSSETLTATVSPNNASNKAISWKSSATDVATVDGNGKVTALKAGVATVTVTTADGGKTASCQVTVTEQAKIVVTGNTAKVPVQGGTAEFNIQYNTSYTVEVEQSASEWLHFVRTRAMQSGTLVFTVDANEGGSRTGKATVKDNEGKVGAITLTFEQDPFIAVTSVRIVPETAEVEIGQTLLLEATVLPEDATDKTVSWSTDNASVATVAQDGTVTAVAQGTATITAAAGGTSNSAKVTVVLSEEDKVKEALMEIYDALDGPHWKNATNWGTDAGLNEWYGVDWNKDKNELKLRFVENGLKGEFPDCFDRLTACTRLWIQVEPGLTGTFPPSFNLLKRLGLLVLERTSMTSLPDVFSGIPFWYVGISGNESMAGPLPESLGESDGLLGEESLDGVRTPGMNLAGNGLTGTIPQSWLRLGSHLVIQNHKFSGQIPDYFYTSDNPGYWINMYINTVDPVGDAEFRKSDPFIVKDRDVPGFWPDRDIKDVITGETIPYKDIVSHNKATVIYRWGSWCGYSAALLPQLRRMHEKYHDAGLEVIMRTAWGDSEGEKKLKDYIRDNGYDVWYNFSSKSENISVSEEAALGSGAMPFVNVIDGDGNVIFSSSGHVSDPSRNRFGHAAFLDLIPFLEDMFGPLDDGEVYSSTDYSEDGKVVTLQTASVGKGINIVFMGDAYTDRDMKVDYGSLMWQAMEEFFSIEPYKTFRDRFNVYYVKVVSKNGKTGSGYTTALGTDASGTTISVSDASDAKSLEYASKVPGIKDNKNLLVCVLVNSSGVRGITSMKENLQSGIAYCASGSNVRDAFGVLIRHEAGGHGFAFLADEYSTDTGSPAPALVNEYNRLYDAYGWYSNIDFTSDPKKVKWSAFLSDDRYKDEVGIYEGAGGPYSTGIYRPSNDSMMNHNVEYYNAPSRWAIYKRIMELSGETSSFNKFLEYDAINRKTSE